jgi:phage regulator Rha-like protein
MVSSANVADVVGSDHNHIHNRLRRHPLDGSSRRQVNEIARNRVIQAAAAS